MSNNFDRFSVHSILNREECPIDKAAYSRFKYGSKSVSRQFGAELGTAFYKRYIVGNADITRDDQLIIAPSPYMFIPTAAFGLKDYMISALNPLLVKEGFKPMQETKIYRETGYTLDYGSMSAAERRNAIGSEQFHTDATFLKDKVVLFLDDIRITGSHEERMIEMIKRLELEKYYKKCIFIYYASLVDAKTDPQIEDYLNLYAINSLLDINKIIANDEFLFNTRNVKYILNAPHVDCVFFLHYQSTTFLQTLYREAIGNSYHLEPKFQMNFNYLQYLVDPKN